MNIVDSNIQCCSICLDRLEYRAKAKPCNHEFCHPCILAWCKNRKRCPLCQESISDIETLQPNILKAYQECCTLTTFCDEKFMEPGFYRMNYSANVELSEWLRRELKYLQQLDHYEEILKLCQTIPINSEEFLRKLQDCFQPKSHQFHIELKRFVLSRCTVQEYDKSVRNLQAPRLTTIYLDDIAMEEVERRAALHRPSFFNLFGLLNISSSRVTTSRYRLQS